MRAVIMKDYGGSDVLSVSEQERPEPGPGQVRVRVAAAAVNPVDVWTRAGVLAGLLPAHAAPPFVLGWDLAGTVDAVGPQAGTWAAGDDVVGMVPWFDALAGAQAEEVLVDAAWLARAPVGMQPAAAATLPLNGLTAAQALDLLALPAGASILVTGAAGGVGGFGVQLARAQGLVVLAVAAPTDEALVDALGADHLVPRTALAAPAALSAAVRDVVPAGVDGVLDAAPAGAAALVAVRDGGAFVTVLDSHVPAAERGVRVAKVSVVPDQGRLTELVGLAERGVLTGRVAEVLPFAEAARAHGLVEAGGVRGRVVLVP